MTNYNTEFTRIISAQITYHFFFFLVILFFLRQIWSQIHYVTEW